MIKKQKIPNNLVLNLDFRICVFRFVSDFELRNSDLIHCGLGVLARQSLLKRSVEHFIGKNLSHVTGADGLAGQ